MGELSGYIVSCNGHKLHSCDIALSFATFLALSVEALSVGDREVCTVVGPSAGVTPAVPTAMVVVCPVLSTVAPVVGRPPTAFGKVLVVLLPSKGELVLGRCLPPLPP